MQSADQQPSMPQLALIINPPKPPNHPPNLTFIKLEKKAKR